jgi:hypothetical protein
MTLDASGNVGIGLTPSSWFANSVVLQLNTGVSLEGRTNDGSSMSLGGNYYLDGSAAYKYLTTNSAQRYTQAAGTHIWYNAGSGAAGNSISWSERMRIDSSGAVTMPSQPAFLATKSAKQSNVAVNSQVTVVFETEVFDQNNDFTSSQFTAPVTGKYQLNLSLYTNELDSAADYYLAVIKTSNREYQNVIDPGVLASDPVYWNQGVSVLADMDANDTAYVFIQQGNGNQQADVATPTLFSGYLVA